MKKINSITEYNKIQATDRKEYELEIRYLENSLATSTIIDLIKLGLSKYNAIQTQFIDSVGYNNNITIRNRTYVENNTTTTTDYSKKESLVKHYKQNIIGKYSINLCKESQVQEDSHTSKILLKRRFSFTIPGTISKDWRFDISIIRKTEPSSMCIKMAFKEFFTDITTLDDLIQRINSKSHIYSVRLEIEYIGTQNVSETDIDKISLFGFLEINPQIENNIKFQQEILYLSNTIYNSILSLPKRKTTNTLYLKYILPKVRILTKQQYFDIYPPTKFLLKEKVNGSRVVISIHDKVAFIITEPHNIISIDIPKYSKKVIVEGEMLENKIQIFDVLVFNDEDILELGIEKRILSIPKCCELLNKLLSDYQFTSANYYSLTNPGKYKYQIEDKFNNNKLSVDGLILTKTECPYKDGINYKWKPLEHQTLDLLCKRCPTFLIKKGNYPEKPNHTLYFLYTTASRNLVQNLKLTTNYGYNDLFKISPEDKNIPIPFISPFVPLSYLYYHPNSADDIDNLICEFNCGIGQECIDHDIFHNRFLVNWNFIKVRPDKEIIPGISYGNNYATAFYTFLNHINIFDISYLYNGVPENQYYQNSGGEINVYSAIRALSNYIKTQLINEYANKAKSVLDIGAGRGGDLFKYVQQNLVKNLIVIDKDKTSLSELFSRWLELGKSSHTVLQTSLRGIVMDINDPYEDNINKIKSMTETTYFNSIFCHSTLHYFCESIESMRNFVSFCQKNTTSGSMVIITCPNGEAIFDLLKNTNTWTSIENDSIKYQINKEYTDNVMTEAGQKISVLLPFSKGKVYPEYLVNATKLIEIFKEKGFSMKLKKTYSKYLEGFNIYKQSKYKQLTNKDKQWSDLYLSLVFKKN